MVHRLQADPTKGTEYYVAYARQHLTQKDGTLRCPIEDCDPDRPFKFPRSLGVHLTSHGLSSVANKAQREKKKAQKNPQAARPKELFPELSGLALDLVVNEMALLRVVDCTADLNAIWAEVAMKHQLYATPPKKWIVPDTFVNLVQSRLDLTTYAKIDPIPIFIEKEILPNEDEIIAKAPTEKLVAQLSVRFSTFLTGLEARAKEIAPALVSALPKIPVAVDVVPVKVPNRKVMILGFDKQAEAIRQKIRDLPLDLLFKDNLIGEGSLPNVSKVIVTYNSRHATALRAKGHYGQENVVFMERGGVSEVVSLLLQIHNNIPFSNRPLSEQTHSV